MLQNVPDLFLHLHVHFEQVFISKKLKPCDNHLTPRKQPTIGIQMQKQTLKVVLESDSSVKFLLVKFQALKSQKIFQQP